MCNYQFCYSLPGNKLFGPSITVLENKFSDYIFFKKLKVKK